MFRLQNLTLVSKVFILSFLLSLSLSPSSFCHQFKGILIQWVRRKKGGEGTHKKQTKRGQAARKKKKKRLPRSFGVPEAKKWIREKKIREGEKSNLAPNFPPEFSIFCCGGEKSLADWVHKFHLSRKGSLLFSLFFSPRQRERQFAANGKWIESGWVWSLAAYQLSVRIPTGHFKMFKPQTPSIDIF